jgi:AraC-like DNA-binding protein
MPVVHDREVIFRRHLPPVPLHSFVATAQGYRVPANPVGLHRGLPSRHLTLVVELGAPLRVSGLGGSVAAHGVVGGLHTRPALIDASAPQEGLQYALTPRGAQVLLGVPAAELKEQAVDLVDLFGTPATQLVDELHAAVGWHERFRVLDVALVRRLGEADVSVPDEVAEAWRMIFATGGRVPVATVAVHVGWSRRHLACRFAALTGLTPKQAARIARFEVTRGFLVRSHRPPLADIAAECGYADQAHLSREWRAMAGCSIGSWLREEFPFVQDGAPGEPAESPV